MAATRRSIIKRAYAELNEQPGVADWGAADVYLFLCGEGLTEAEAREVTESIRDPEPGELND